MSLVIRQGAAATEGTSAIKVLVRQHVWARRNVRKQKIATESDLSRLWPHFFSDSVWYFDLFCQPDYLQRGRHVPLAELGIYCWIPFVFADHGTIGGGLSITQPGIAVIKNRYTMRRMAGGSSTR